MRLEFPSYYQNFRCIAGECRDSCCSGWEVDVDPESAAYYRSLPGLFGDRLRETLLYDAGEEEKAESGEEGEHGGYYFPLTEDKNCPFLNVQGLCDMYTALGEDSLCQVCTEYPRYFIPLGAYQQMDLNLSCIEVARILFSETERIQYLSLETEEEGEVLTEEEEERLQYILRKRNQWLSLLLHGRGGIFSRLKLMYQDMEETEPTLPEDRASMESTASFLRLLSGLTELDTRWKQLFQALCRRFGERREEEIRGEAKRFYREKQGALESFLTKLSAYLVFRYAVDAFGEDSFLPLERFVQRFLRLNFLAALLCYQEKGDFTEEDMAEQAHLLSKEVEHDMENVERLKAGRAEA